MLPHFVDLVFLQVSHQNPIFPHIFMMHRCGFISFIATWVLLVYASSDDLSSFVNFDQSLWDPAGSETIQSTLDPFDSSLESLNVNDGSTDLFSEGNDNSNLLFANTPSPGGCAAAGADDLTLKTRDDGGSCQSEKQTSSSPILSPESVQLFDDPTTLLNDLLLPPSKEEQSPSGSGEPPQPPRTPNPPDPPLYPGYLSDEDARRRLDSSTVWSPAGLGLTAVKGSFFCVNPNKKIPVCCDGPFDWDSNLEECDTCKALVVHGRLLLSPPHPLRRREKIFPLNYHHLGIQDSLVD